ncbi:nucleotidyltransferase domain-containing protein [Methanosarcina hadiensis]|uniref:nucleotidyltransferase family protein n=1 Tax=Methanosarcina hadiensis TaxID=3078083 RepID=UPI0039774EA7
MSIPSPIYQKSIQELRSLIFETFKDENVIVILFGSRARGDYSRVSDIDIGILPENDLDKKKIVLLKEKIDELNIPYTVDIVDLSRVSKTFRERALRDGVVWKN